MLEYYRANPLVSFGFVAAPDLEEGIKNKKIDDKNGCRRFKFYKRMMINLFGPKTFYQEADTTNTIYLMINMTQLSTDAITIKDVEDKLNNTYNGFYTIS